MAENSFAPQFRSVKSAAFYEPFYGIFVYSVASRISYTTALCSACRLETDSSPLVMSFEV